MSLALAKALGRKDYRRAIEILRDRLSGSASDASDLALIAQCHLWLLEDASAIEAAEAALLLDPDFFSVHKLLASLYFRRREHRLGTFHAKLAIRTFKPSPKIPKVLAWLLFGVIFLIRGRAAARAAYDDIAPVTDPEHAWVEWARGYVLWSKRFGDFDPSNEPFFAAPGDGV
jgi:hypothetical protein